MADKHRVVILGGGFGGLSAARHLLGEHTGAPVDKAGRIIVEPDLTVPGHPEIFVVGDLANYSHQTGKPLPGVAQPAIQQGRYAAKVVERRSQGKQAMKPFRYFDKGNLATIGRGAAVADLNWLRLSGWPAWLIWVFIHLLYISTSFNSRTGFWYSCNGAGST